MAYSIITPQSSFVRFDGEQSNHCLFGDKSTCLPVALDSDVAFQFVVQGTEEEIDSLCDPEDSGLQIGLVSSCAQPEFDVTFLQEPQRFRISPTQVLYNWTHGLTGAMANYDVGECFFIRVIVAESLTGCSNCFQRIEDDCFTSVVEYGNDENFGGFNYCNSGEIPGGGGEDITCEPTVITFTLQSTLNVPYTAQLKDKYGDIPTVQVWIYDENGVLTNMGITAQFDAMPPNNILFDFGGPASGVIVIR
jgi:hypothetical protein